MISPQKHCDHECVCMGYSHREESIDDLPCPKDPCIYRSLPAPVTTFTILSSEELILLAENDWHNREERKHLHPKIPWVSGWITGFLSMSKLNWSAQHDTRSRPAPFSPSPIMPLHSFTRQRAADAASRCRCCPRTGASRCWSWWSTGAQSPRGPADAAVFFFYRADRGSGLQRRRAGKGMRGKQRTRAKTPSEKRASRYCETSRLLDLKRRRTCFLEAHASWERRPIRSSACPLRCVFKLA